MGRETNDNLINRLYEKHESLVYGIEQIEKKIQTKLKGITVEKNKVWTPSGDEYVEIAELELAELEKKKLDLQVFKANIKLQILESEFSRDKYIGIDHSQNEKKQYEDAKTSIISFTRMNIKKAADTGIITKDEISFYNDSIETKSKNVFLSKQKNKKESVMQKDYEAVEKFKKKYVKKLERGEITMEKIYYEIADKHKRTFAAVKGAHTQIQRKKRNENK